MISLIVWGIFSHSTVFSVVVLLLAGVFYLTHKKQPREIDAAITGLGIVFGDEFYPFVDVRKFWILYDPPEVKTLNLLLKKGTVREVQIELQNQDPSEVRAILTGEIEEWSDRVETLSEVLIRILKL